MPTGNPKAAVTKALSLFKQSIKQPKSPAELVRLASEILVPLSSKNTLRSDKTLDELERYLEEMVLKLYGDSETHPNPEEAAALSREVFKDRFFELLIKCVPLMKESSRKPAEMIVDSVQNHARQAASQYLKAHPELLTLLLKGYENAEVALYYGNMLRDCMRHQEAARHILQSGSYLLLFEYIQQPQFEVSSDAAATLKELLLRHKSTAAEFLTQSANSQKFFLEYNKLMQSETYITRRTSVKLLADVMQDRAYGAVLAAYVRDAANLRPVMNVLKDSSKAIQTDGFPLFKAIALHPAKCEEITHILVTNKDKLQRVLAPLKLEKASEEDVQKFEQEKQDLLKAIAAF